MKHRLFCVICALSFTLSLCTTAFAETYSITLSSEEAASDVPILLTIPAQTPAGVGEEANRIVITAPATHAAVEIPISGSPSKADLFYVNSDGTYTTVAPVIQGTSSLCLMLPETSASLIVLEKVPFTDTKRTAWYYNSATYVYHNALMNGTGKQTFAPNGTVSRMMVALILWRQAEEPTPTGTASFSDIPDDAYYTDAVLWCAEQKIMTGTGDTTFLPNKNITREQLALVLYRFCAATGADTSQRADLSKFTDTAKVSKSAKDAMSWAVAEGLIAGTAKGALNPSGTLTRSELATILMRFCAK